MRKRKFARKSPAAIVGRFATAILLAVVAAAFVAAQQKASTATAEASSDFDQGLAAYKAGQFASAAQQFQQASQLDPSLLNAQLYLAASYNAQVVPNNASAANRKLEKEALQEYELVATGYPTNLAAIDGAGSALYNLSQSPFDAAGMDNAKTHWQRHVQINPSDPEPHYWIGVIDWALANDADQEMRSQYAWDSRKDLGSASVLPALLTAQYSTAYRTTIDEGVTQLQSAIAAKPNYTDAMAYLNLLYRLKADTEASTQAREEDLQSAEGLASNVVWVKNAQPAPQANR